jgi:hypothetical protein
MGSRGIALIAYKGGKAIIVAIQLILVSSLSLGKVVLSDREHIQDITSLQQL